MHDNSDMSKSECSDVVVRFLFVLKSKELKLFV